LNELLALGTTFGAATSGLGLATTFSVIARSDLLSTCEKRLSEPQRQGLTFLAEFSGRHTSGRRRAVGAGQHEARFNRLWPVASAPPKKIARILR